MSRNGVYYVPVNGRKIPSNLVFISPDPTDDLCFLMGAARITTTVVPPPRVCHFEETPNSSVLLKYPFVYVANPSSKRGVAHIDAGCCGANQRESSQKAVYEKQRSVCTHCWRSYKGYSK